ncbi:toll-interacting protein B-like [Nylanderia fulva]|uniref:toll-interacting protein B-like n=1 Tax=Nylanderia fulva TaxID=613905 RepID=UPI0010FB9215|nr:toll-interacting protein B-like [Nylanderia fulva]
MVPQGTPASQAYDAAEPAGESPRIVDISGRIGTPPPCGQGSRSGSSGYPCPPARCIGAKHAPGIGTDNTSRPPWLFQYLSYCNLLPPGVTQIFIEIYDECSFMMDELIAWGHIEIPPQVFQKGDTHEDWYMLSGKQGENQEGMINLVFSYMIHHPYMSFSIMMVPSATPMFGVPYAPLNVYIPPPAVATPTVAPSSLPNAEIELKQIAEMFPNIDKEVIKSVYDANHDKKDVTINSLLQMCE